MLIVLSLQWNLIILERWPTTSLSIVGATLNGATVLKLIRLLPTVNMGKVFDVSFHYYYSCPYIIQFGMPSLLGTSLTVLLFLLTLHRCRPCSPAGFFTYWGLFLVPRSLLPKGHLSALVGEELIDFILSQSFVCVTWIIRCVTWTSQACWPWVVFSELWCSMVWLSKLRCKFRRFPSCL